MSLSGTHVWDEINQLRLIKVAESHRFTCGGVVSSQSDGNSTLKAR